MPLSLAQFDRLYYERGIARLAGVDEAGRGCLAGPVVAAAVILPPGVDLPGVADSKTLSAARREAAFEAITRVALAVGVGVCSPAEIDRLNILHAAMEAMRRAVTALTPAPDLLLVDGNRLPPRLPCSAEALVKGDGRSLAVGAASIIAKVTRDREMARLHTLFPDYGWTQNKGYPTGAHYAALEAHGPTSHHRRSFRLGRTEPVGLLFQAPASSR